MSTRSLIAYENKNGSIAAIYCHFDGDLEGVGQMLKDVYPSEEDAKSVILEGPRSMLTGDSSFDGLYQEKDGIVLLKNLDKLLEHGDNMTAEFIYLFTDGHWQYSQALDINIKKYSWTPFADYAA